MIKAALGRDWRSLTRDNQRCKAVNRFEARRVVRPIAED